MLRITKLRNPLTAREMEVAELLYHGMTDSEVAWRLNIVNNTVKQLAARARLRLHIKDGRIGLALWYQRWREITESKRLLDLAAQVGCRAVWFSGHEGAAWHCNCDDVRHAACRESALITFESLEDNQ